MMQATTDPASRANAALRLFLTLLLVAWAGALQAQECTDCHDVEMEATTAHVDLDCATCHEGREEFPHPEDLTLPSCATCHSYIADEFALGVHGIARAQGNDMAPDCSFCHGAAHAVERPGTTPFRRDTVDLCSSCHPDEADHFLQSIHGRALLAGNRGAPNCVSCHGEHHTENPSGHIRETCAQCHGDVELAARFGLPGDRIISFDQSFHGLATRAGSQRVANCASCHGYHLVLPSTDPESTTHPENLPDTCGECHPGAGQRFTIGPVHFVEGGGQEPVADLIRAIYLYLLIPATLILMFIHNLGDWIRKLRVRLRTPRYVQERILEVRMLPMERIQHALLAISFIILVWSGFALKFPDQWWAWPLVAPGPEFRAVIHRIFAVIMIAGAILHVLTIIFSRTLRHRWMELLPRGRDVGEAAATFAYNVGLRRFRPRISPHSYIEKAEYWAVVWGTFIMGLTGIILWAENFFLQWGPGWLMNVSTVIHYYEAILAGAAIVIWHFYWVIFDPNVYPISMAWWNGKGPARTEMDATERIADGELTVPPPDGPEGTEE